MAIKYIIIPLWHPSLKQLEFWLLLSIRYKHIYFILVHDHLSIDPLSLNYVDETQHHLKLSLLRRLYQVHPNFRILNKDFSDGVGIPASFNFALNYISSFDRFWSSQFALLLDQDTFIDNISSLPDNPCPQTIYYPQLPELSSTKSFRTVLKALNLPWCQWSGTVINLFAFRKLLVKQLPPVNHSDLIFFITAQSFHYSFEILPNLSISHEASPDNRLTFFGFSFIVHKPQRALQTLISTLRYLTPLLLSNYRLIKFYFIVLARDLSRFFLSIIISLF